MSHSAQNMLQIFSVPLNLPLVIFKDKLPYILSEKKRKWCRNCLNSVLSHTVYIYPRSFLSPIFPSQWKRSHFYIQSKYVSVVVLRIIVLRWKKLNMFMHQRESYWYSKEVWGSWKRWNTFNRQVFYLKPFLEATKLNSKFHSFSPTSPYAYFLSYVGLYLC